MTLSCYLCACVCKTADDYTNHLRNRHVLIEPCTLVCNAQGCSRTFQSYNSLRKHIHKQHSCILETANSLSNADGSQQSSSSSSVLLSPTENDDANETEQVHVASHPPIIDSQGVSQAAVKFVMALLSSSVLPVSTVSFIQNSTTELVRDIVQFLKARTISTIAKVQGNLNMAEVNELIDDFDGWLNPFKHIESQHQLLTYLKKQDVYVSPVEHVLGKRWELREDRVSKKCKQIEVNDSFYYVPMLDTVKLILRNEDNLTLIKKAEKVKADVAHDWLDGENGARLKQYCKEHAPDSIPIYIQIYFDEVETVNPLGSKTGIHKLGAFYFVIKNFPASVNSSLNNIHLLALAHAADLKKYSVDGVMKVVVEELMQLHDVGFHCMYETGREHFRCYLTQVVGDNLGLHSLLGYTENFSKANYACDMCMATQDEIQSVFSECNIELRSEDLYDHQVKNLELGMVTTSECGIKRPSVLIRLPYYHPASNDSVEIMHDMMEGVLLEMYEN